MKKTLFAMLFLMLFAGCKIREKLVPTPYPVVERHDSIVYRTVKDTTAHYPAQKNAVVTPRKSFLKTDLAFSNASIDSIGMLHHSIENCGQIPARIIKEIKTLHDSIPYPVYRDVPVPTPIPLTWWQKLFIVLGKVFCAVIALVITGLFIIILNKKSLTE
ncbi:MAG TPA: hypothetical protein VK152_11660 [Paludibacter sp.]|nr:hypothetical protein [Paludibacter sp.]